MAAKSSDTFLCQQQSEDWQQQPSQKNACQNTVTLLSKKQKGASPPVNPVILSTWVRRFGKAGRGRPSHVQGQVTAGIPWADPPHSKQTNGCKRRSPSKKAMENIHCPPASCTQFHFFLTAPFSYNTLSARVRHIAQSMRLCSNTRQVLLWTSPKSLHSQCLAFQMLGVQIASVSHFNKPGQTGIIRPVFSVKCPFLVSLRDIMMGSS